MSNEPLDEIQWKSPEWIQQFGLFTGNVLDYFSESPFYDRTSNNQVLRMQFQFQPPPANMNPQTYFESKLKEMVGIEFIIAYVREPDFWIIRKQRRLNVETVISKNDYYIIGANVYQAPKIHDVISSRILSSVLSISKSIDTLNKMNTFSVQDQSALSSSANEFDDPGKTLATPNQHQTPQTNTPQLTTVGSVSYTTSSNEIQSAVFDNLLNGVISNDNSIYLEDIPLYGKGSTIEFLGLKSDPNV
ncbi:uncharacterized protein PRCAT00000869001 [Priceomyces carsonii]|uniref:uncharacterized protein n=1 Tax=Priceomyces carsonii TaxID=28549 RepID=UPI002EDB2725|nr:unnamed protein product [Priceomyces carsonii]